MGGIKDEVVFKRKGKDERTCGRGAGGFKDCVVVGLK